MLWTLFVALLAGWTTGVVTGKSFGGALHFLLLGAVILLFLETLIYGKSMRNSDHN